MELLLSTIVAFAISTAGATDKDDLRDECLRSSNQRPNPVLCKALRNDLSRIPKDILSPPSPVIPPPSEIPAPVVAPADARGSFCERDIAGCATYIITGLILTTITLGYFSYWYSVIDEVSFHPAINADDEGLNSISITMKGRF